MAAQLPNKGRVLALDIGDARIGLATAHVIARIPTPIETVPNDDSLVPSLNSIIEREGVTLAVVGIPRNLKGELTEQSNKIIKQAEELGKVLDVDIVYADESLSSKRADEYLAGQKNSTLSQDSVAACFILEEFMKEVI